MTDVAGRWLRWTGLDAAVLYGALARGWMLLAGPITLLFIARFMSPDMQGFYYTFASIVALQSFLELGFYLVIINFASHEWATLRLDEAGRISGDPIARSRLVSLGRLVFVWYGVLSALFVLIVGPAGFAFFSSSRPAGVDWQGPWIGVVLLTGVMLWVLPLVSILEGCNQVAVVNRFRFKSAVVGNLALWTTLALGGGLWASVVWVAVNAGRDLILLLIRYRRFFESFLTPPSQWRIAWRTEIWPMQWRLAVSGLVNYFMFSLFNPVMFRYHGAAVAGQMGMTWALASGVQSLALMWVYPKVPQAGMLIARREYDALDRFWLGVSFRSMAVTVLGLTAAWGAIAALNRFDVSLASRLLPPGPSAVLLLGVLVAQISQCMSAYLRAHKREPIAVMSVTSSLLIGALVWVLGKNYGPIGAAAAFLAVYAGVVLPWETMILRQCRAMWHAQQP